MSRYNKDMSSASAIYNHNLPKQYYHIDPDEASYFVSISNLNEKQKEYITTIIDLDVDDDEDSHPKFPTKYSVDAPLRRCNKEKETYPFDEVLEYLNKQKFVMIDDPHF